MKRLLELTRKMIRSKPDVPGIAELAIETP
jgi:hypothetical protein